MLKGPAGQTGQLTSDTSMRLELISHHPENDNGARPLLFVHGAFSGAWIWADHFLPWFAERGVPAHALSLRGHGESDGEATLASARMKDYVADLARSIDKIGTLPVVVGHSMGGMVVQKYLEKRDLPGAVLMASVPPHGLGSSALRMMMSEPDLYMQLGLLQAFGASHAHLDVILRAMFADPKLAEDKRYLMKFAHNESATAVGDMMGLDPLKIRRDLDTPISVMGADKDKFVSRVQLKATASAYRAPLTLFQNMGHAMMLEHEWESVAQAVLDFHSEVA